MRRRPILQTLLLILCLQAPLVSAEVVKIGVFSSKNFRQSMQKWQPTAKFLGQQMPEHVFQVLPYSDYKNLSTDLAKNKLDMVLTKSSNLAEVMSEFSLLPVIQQGNWTLARSRQLPERLSSLVSNNLLKYPGNKDKLYWQLIASNEIELSLLQRFSAWSRQTGEASLQLVKEYLDLFIACLVSTLLIFSYRHWDRYHLRKQRVKQHKEQAHDKGLSNTVF